MSSVERSIEVDAPLSAAYNEWTDFEAYPKFMEGVRQVRLVDPTHLHWRASIGGKEQEWDAEIVQQVPDELIAWRSVKGARKDETVTFDPVGERRTRVTLRVEYEPAGMFEKLGRFMGVVSSRIEGDLARFKRLIEASAADSRRWPGEIPNPR
ncbi:MAG: SRPBCC family protein [Betaproteobacteria bacterium]